MKRILILNIVIVSSSLFSFINERDYIKAFVVGEIKSKNCFISFVIINGTRYIVKQKKGIKKQSAVVKEALAAFVAAPFKFSHLVKVISPDVSISGKINVSWPATLHTIVPGVEVRTLTGSKYGNLELQQHSSHTDDKGLNATIIQQITWHKQLPVMVALDLFIGNAGRHGGNLFYDTKTDTFWAIDMDSAFRYNLCEYAYENLKNMISVHKKFSKKEMYALMRLNTTLAFLYHTYPPQDLIEKLYLFGREAGFSPAHPLYKRLLLAEQVIKDSYKSCRKLLSLLDSISYDFLKEL